MRIWVDADACPAEIKQLLYRAAKRRQVQVTLVANQRLAIPASPFIDLLVVTTGLDAADRRIVDEVAAGDLVVTADIPLAAAVVEKGADALNPRGQLYTEANIGARLAERNLLDQLRNDGLVAGGPSEFGSRDRQQFANQLDRWLTKSQ